MCTEFRTFLLNTPLNIQEHLVDFRTAESRFPRFQFDSGTDGAQPFKITIHIRVLYLMPKALRFSVMSSHSVRMILKAELTIQFFQFTDFRFFLRNVIVISQKIVKELLEDFFKIIIVLTCFVHFNIFVLINTEDGGTKFPGALFIFPFFFFSCFSARLQESLQFHLQKFPEILFGGKL